MEHDDPHLGGRATRLLLNDRVTVRLLTLLAIGIIVNLVCWTVGWLVLPEGALRGLFPGAHIVPNAGAARVFISILVYNVGIAGGIIAIANVFRVGTFPLGYLAVLVHWGLFGLLTGTGSFGVARHGVAPSVHHLVSSAGFVEISAYTFIAAATTGLFLYRQRSWLDWTTEKVGAIQELSLSRCEIVTILSAIAMCCLAALQESHSILA